MRKKNLYLLLFFILLFIYEELVFHLAVFDTITFNFVYVILFSIPFGVIAFLISNMWNKITNIILSYVFVIAVMVLFISNLIYYKVYLSVISIYSMINGGQAFEFMGKILSTAFENWFVIIAMILPIVTFIVLHILKIFRLTYLIIILK